MTNTQTPPERGISSPAKPGFRLVAMCAVFMLAVPALNGFLLNYLMLNMAGDVLLADICVFLGYAADALTFASAYIGAGLLCVSLVAYGGRRSAPVTAMYIISLVLPYAGLICTTAWTTSDFAANSSYYFAVSLMYLALDIAVFAAIIVISALVRRRFASAPDASLPIFSPRKNPFALALMLSCAAILLIAVVGEAVNTVGFFIDYGFTATAAEVISMVSAYLMPAAQFFVGFLVNCLIADWVRGSKQRPRRDKRPACAQ